MTKRRIMVRAKRTREEDVLAPDAVNPALVLLPLLYLLMVMTG